MKSLESKKRKNPGWAPFEQRASDYDAWFETKKGRRIFQVETDCLRDLLEETPRPWLEIGIGTGRFAEALGIKEGIDPSPAVLQYASNRGIETRVGTAEKLPYEDNSFGVTLMVVTICFLENPEQAMRECRRVLRKNGVAVLGLVPKDSPWGTEYAKKGAVGHTFYSNARFYTTNEVMKMTEEAGFCFNRAASCLFEPPNRNIKKYARPKNGIVKNAGFVCMQFKLTR